jgi:hypothetical protein
MPASKSGSQPQHVDVEASSKDDVPLQRRRKVSHGSGPLKDGCHAGGPGACVSLTMETSRSGDGMSTCNTPKRQQHV